MHGITWATHLLVGAAKMGMDFRTAAPKAYPARGRNSQISVNQ